MQKDVYINRVAKFLPGDPVSNDEMEDYLGLIDGNRSRAKAVILRNNRIKTRHYARDKNGNSTHTNSEITAEAIKALCIDDFKISDIELLCSATATPDQLLPAHGLMVHGLLPGARAIESITFAGSCCSGMNALKYAHMSVLSGNSDNAVCTASERASAWLANQYFEEEAHKLKEVDDNPIIAFEKEFLRWMLSDGAAATLLSDRPNPDSLSLKLEWIDICSFANEVETCMYAGAEKKDNGDLKGWAAFEQKEWVERSIFAIKQDTRLLEKYIVQVGMKNLAELLARRGVEPKSIDWFLPHVSSDFFRAKVDDEMKKYGIQVPEEQWFINLRSVGNIGSASIFIALEELFSSGRLARGQRIVLSVPESTRFTYATALLTVV